MAQRGLSPRALVALLSILALGAVGAVVTTAGAADDSEGTVSLDNPMVGWNGHHYDVGATPRSELCNVPASEVCDRFKLTVDIDPSHWESHRGGVEVKIAWEDGGDDFDLRVYDADGRLVGSSLSASGTGERVFVEDASGEYEVRVNPYTVTDSSYQGGAHVESRAIVDGDDGEVPTEPVSNLPCTDGKAGPFPCDGVDLESFLPRDAIGGGELNDIWGWTDPETGREYALVGKTSGTAFVDVTDAQSPQYLGDLPSHQPVETIFNIWRDLKVYEDHVYVVSEEPLHGMQVFDLTRLRDATEPQTWTADSHYALFGNAHNLAINEESGFAYAIGTSTCQGGPHIVDIREPKDPRPAGCVFQDGYTHDTQCVNYDGPDERYAGREICFNSNEDTLTIVDVTEKLNPVQLSRTTYDNASYTHQGWLTEDSRHFLLNDELDEQQKGVPTSTYVFDVTRLDNPTVKSVWREGRPASIDHNLYVKGERVYESNYRSGLRIGDISNVEQGEITEAGFFDVFPADDEPEFNGTWSNYPYFASGNIIVSGIEQGLFVLSEAGGQDGDDDGDDDEPAECTNPKGKPKPCKGGGPGKGRGKP